MDGKSSEPLRNLGGAVASSGLSMVMDTWADVDLEWISRLLSRP